MEYWKQFFESEKKKYFISDLCKVKSVDKNNNKEIILKTRINKNGVNISN